MAICSLEDEAPYPPFAFAQCTIQEEWWEKRHEASAENELAGFLDVNVKHHNYLMIPHFPRYSLVRWSEDAARHQSTHPPEPAMTNHPHRNTPQQARIPISALPPEHNSEQMIEQIRTTPQRNAQSLPTAASAPTAQNFFVRAASPISWRSALTGLGRPEAVPIPYTMREPCRTLGRCSSPKCPVFMLQSAEEALWILEGH